MIDSPENELAMRAKCGDTDAAEELIRNAGWLPKQMLKRMASGVSKGEGLEDMMQDANVAMLEAIQTYEPNRGARYTTYAHYRVFHAVYKASRARTSVVKTYYYDDQITDASLSKPCFAEAGDGEGSDAANQTENSAQDYVADEAPSPELTAHRKSLKVRVAELLEACGEFDEIDQELIRQRFMNDDDDRPSLRDLAPVLKRSHEALRLREKKIGSLLPSILAPLKDAA